MRKVLGLFFLSLGALAQNEKGKIVEVTKATPVFSAPQRAAKVVADADPGSAFTVLKLSPNKGWLYLMDEDGNKGWVPTQRTNYFVISAPIADPNQEKAKAAASETNQEKNKQAQKQNAKNEEAEEGTGNTYRDSKMIFAAVFRKGFQDPNGNYGAGVKVFINNAATGSGMRHEKMGLEVGYIHMLGQKKGEAAGYSIPLRYKMLSRANNSGFVSGPDLGVLFLKVRPPSKKSFWKTNLSLGYSVGYNPVGSSVFVWLRPGAELLYKNRISVEGNMSWLF